MYTNNFTYPYSSYGGFYNLPCINPNQYYNQPRSFQEPKETLENQLYIREDNVPNKDLLTTNIKQQADELIKMASYSVDLCTVATAIALSDEKVITKLTEKILEGNVYNCHGCLSTFELIYVYFDFDCPPGVFCFVKPSFAAVVNLITRKVVDIADPFTFSKCDTLKKN